MYAQLAAVQILCINVRPGLDSAFVAQQAALVDAIIDAKLGENFMWPIGPLGTPVNAPPPPLIQQVANMLTAAKVERLKYAVNEAGGPQGGNPYAQSLEESAMTILDQLSQGTLIIPELRENAPIRHSASPQAFLPVRGSGFGRRAGLGGRRG